MWGFSREIEISRFFVYRGDLFRQGELELDLLREHQVESQLNGTLSREGRRVDRQSRY